MSRPLRSPGAVSFFFLSVDARDGIDEGACVVGLRIVEDVVGGAAFNNAASLHDHDAVSHVVHHAEVVGDEKVGVVVAAFEVVEQVEDLRLHAHVKGGHALVADDQFGLQYKGSGDTDALSLNSCG